MPCFCLVLTERFLLWKSDVALLWCHNEWINIIFYVKGLFIRCHRQDLFLYPCHVRYQKATCFASGSVAELTAIELLQCFEYLLHLLQHFGYLLHLLQHFRYQFRDNRHDSVREELNTELQVPSFGSAKLPPCTTLYYIGRNAVICAGV